VKTRIKAATLASLIAILSTPLLADSDQVKSKSLESQIEALQTRISALEARQSFASFMPDFAERFHVMHRASDAEDWAVASHELAQMKQLARLSTSIDPEKGQLLQAMMGPSFEALSAGIEKADRDKFRQALPATIASCNACHAATGSAFIQVTLDARDSLSIRHPHEFTRRDAPRDHGHENMPGESAGGGHDEAGEAAHDEAGEAAHDDTGKAAHND